MKPRAIDCPWLYPFGGDNVHETDMVDLKAIVTILSLKDKVELNPFAKVPHESIKEALCVIEEHHKAMI
jgi:hypothetical protein